MTAADRLARLREIDERWWGVHTSHDLTTGRTSYGSAHQHAGQDIGWLMEQVKALTVEVDALRAQLPEGCWHWRTGQCGTGGSDGE